MIEKSKIGFIGGGNMGEALVKGLIGASLVAPEQIYVYDVLPARLDYLKETYKVGVCKTIAELAEAARDVLFIAVKPQNMAQALEALAPHVVHAPLVISIAAGVPIAAIAGGLPEGTPVVRVMPNTPALVLQAASALARGAHVTDEKMQTALALFRAVGMAVEVEEKSMDAVTGLSGSGPAYFLLLMEAFIDGGVLMGLPRPVARDLAVQTALGAARMVLETGRHPAELKDMITSPGGTTIAGLQELEDSGVRGALMRAVEAATIRSKELGKAK